MEFLAISGSDGTIQLMNRADYIIYDQKKVHQELVRGLAFSKDGKQLFSCGDDGKIFCCTTDNNKLDKTSNDYKSSLFKPWITAIDVCEVPQDIWKTQMIAYTTIRGDVYMETEKLQYYYPIKGEIFRLHFLPRQGYEFIIGLGTDQGLKLLYKKEAKFFQNPGAKGKMK
jgi:WD40 repeat protein